MLKPVCVPCRRFFRMKKQGFYFVEGMPAGPQRGRPGNAEPEAWQPYKLWASDRWECEGCGAAILSGFGLAPVAVRHDYDFVKRVHELGAHQLQVNDC